MFPDSGAFRTFTASGVCGIAWPVTPRGHEGPKLTFPAWEWAFGTRRPRLRRGGLPGAEAARTLAAHNPRRKR